ncbi:MAG: tRNA (mo5U34)-methyltransferase, partial [Granulosicoccus sp.]
MTELAFDVDRLVDDLVGSELEPWSVRLGQSVRDQEHALKHGHLAGWEAAVAALPLLADIAFSVNDGVVTIDATADSEDTERQLKEALQGLIPWRKGPFKFASETIDTEWRSDWKWDRIESYLTPLDGRVVLDVG